MVSTSSLRFAPLRGIRVDLALKFTLLHEDSPKLSINLDHIDKADVGVPLIPYVKTKPASDIIRFGPRPARL